MVLDAVNTGGRDGDESRETHLKGDRLAGLGMPVTWVRWYS